MVRPLLSSRSAESAHQAEVAACERRAPECSSFAAKTPKEAERRPKSSETSTRRRKRAPELSFGGSKTVDETAMNRRSKTTTTSNEKWRPKASLWALLGSLSLLSVFSSSRLIVGASNWPNGGQSGQPIEQFLKQNFPLTSKALPLSQDGLHFDISSYKSAHEAIRAHPDLREVSVASAC